jgi:glutathione S-transferase
MLTIWGRQNSINVQKVMWTIAELGLPHRRIDLGGAFGGNKEAQALARNPNGLVPVLEDGDAIIWESNAIVRYLAAKHDSGGLWPVEPEARAAADRWMDWQLTVAHPALVPLFLQLVRTPEDSRDVAKIADAKNACISALSILERWLLDQDFVGGDRFTMGDFGIGCTLHRWYMLPLDRLPMPAVQRYFERLCKRKPFEEQVLSVPLS